MLRKLYDFIAGGSEAFSFEHRIFNTTCFIGTAFTTLGFALNFGLELEQTVVLLSLVGIGYGMLQYGISRLMGMFRPLFIDLYVVVTNVLLAYSFFYNSGSSGTVFYMLLVNFFVFMLIARQQQQLRVAGVFLLTLVLLIAAELEHPEWIRSYESGYQRILDHATLLAYSFLFTALIVRLFRRDYDGEKQRIEAQRQELDTLYQKSTEKNAYIESLIRELHHRVKNNLQVVSSLLALQSKRLQDPNARLALEDGRSRVNAMALIHQKLYLQDELAAVDMQDYLQKLSHSLAESYGFPSTMVHTAVLLPGSSLDIDRAVPIGLIVNELITNACKHAFKGVADPQVHLRLEQRNGLLELRVSDNGKGLLQMPDPSQSFGMKLVHTLAEQLNATLQLEPAANGTTFYLRMTE